MPASATPSSTARVAWSDRTLTLRDDEMFGMRAGAVCERFLKRVFQLEEVKGVEIDRDRGTALVRCQPGRAVVEILQRVATAIRSAPTEPTLDLITPGRSHSRWILHRCHGLISSWELAGERPGLVRLRHPALTGDPAFAARVTLLAEGLEGVEFARRGLLIDDLTIRFDPARTGVERLVRALEAATRAEKNQEHHEPDAPEVEPSPVKFGPANAAWALAAVTDLVVPALWPATAAVLITTNLRTFGQAARQASKGRLGMPALYTGIASATLASNQFLPWATMSWMMRYWRRCSDEQTAAARRRLLGEVVGRQPFARLAAAGSGGVEVSAPVRGLGPGDVVLVGPGERVPIDGKIVRGHALVDERLVRGVAGRIRKKPDDLVHAGSMITAGEIGVEVGAEAPGAPSRATLLTRATTAAGRSEGWSPSRTPARHHGFAERAVVPTLATAGLGLLMGGAPTALAVMRADYASGPRHACSIVNLQAVAQCVREGIVVLDPDALGRLLDVDVFLIEHHPALEAAEPEIDVIRVFPDHSEYQVLRFAAAALRDVDDERASALLAACDARRIPPLDGVAIEYGGDLVLRIDDQTVKVGNLGVDDPAPPGGARMTGEPGLDALMVGIDGRIAGLIHFRRSSRLAVATTIQDLRACTRRSLAVGLISRRPDARLGGLAEALGFDFHEEGVSNDDLDHLIRACRTRGLAVAYVGDCLDRPAAAREADLAVCLDARDLTDLDRNPAAAVFLTPDLDKLATLYEVARAQRKAIKTAQSTALLPNLFCVAGALLMGFSSMTTVVVTNLATYGTYSRNASAIRDMELRLSQFSPRRRSRAAAPTTPRAS